MPERPARVWRRPPQATARRGDFGDAAGNEGSGGIVAEIEAVDDSGGESDDVFKGSAKLDPGDIVGGIDAQGR